MCVRDKERLEGGERHRNRERDRDRQSERNRDREKMSAHLQSHEEFNHFRLKRISGEKPWTQSLK